MCKTNYVLNPITGQTELTNLGSLTQTQSQSSNLPNPLPTNLSEYTGFKPYITCSTTQQGEQSPSESELKERCNSMGSDKSSYGGFCERQVGTETKSIPVKQVCSQSIKWRFYLISVTGNLLSCRITT